MSTHAPLPPRRSPKEAAADLVAMFVPGASDEEKAIRARIRLACDTAQARRERASSFHGGRLYADTATIARDWMFKQRASMSDLEEVLKVLTWLFLAAGALERLEAPDE